MFKLTNPFDGSLIQYSAFSVNDREITRTWFDANGNRQFETALAICTEVDSIPPNEYTAEQFLNQSGFSSIRLLTLLDIEGKLKSAGKSSPKMDAVRTWIDSILMQFAMNPEPKSDWPTRPYLFEETVQEALSILNS
jgi:hypothetical protein